MRKIGAFVLAVGLAISGVEAKADPYVAPSTPLPAGSARFNIDEPGQWGRTSMLIVTKNRPGESMPDEHYCQGFGAGPCNLDNKHYVLTSDSILIAPRCTASTQTNCIEGLGITSAGEETQAAQFVRHIDGPVVPADPRHGLTAGSTISLWKTTNSAGVTNDYSAQVAFQLRYNTGTKKFSVQGITASVEAFKETSSNFIIGGVRETVTSKGRHSVQLPGYPSGCVWAETGRCGAAVDFPEGVRISLSLRVSNQIGGWFSGRLAEADIKIKKLSAVSNQITVAAKPVEVPRFSVVVEKAKASNKALAYLESRSSEHDVFVNPFTGGGWGSNTRADYPNSFDVVEAFRADGGDTSAGTSTLWGFRNSSIGSGSPCLQDTTKVLGLVTTNATVYQGEAPNFVGGYLNYKVAGLHYQPNGIDPALGSYDLIMRKSVAQCLYGFGAVPVNASIAVVNGQGKKSAATTVLSERGDWLAFSAKGFTFSKKTIKVKVTKKAVKK